MRGRAGDTIVHVAGGPAHTLIGGDERPRGAHLRAAASRRRSACCPASVAWLADSRVEAGSTTHPWAAEAALGIPEGTPGERPANVVAPRRRRGRLRRDRQAPRPRGGRDTDRAQLAALPPNEEGAPPHCHSADEEIFVVLDGEGTLELWAPPSPAAPAPDRAAETPPSAAATSSPGRRHPHLALLPGGDAGLTYLAYGTREPNDICYYPRSNKVFFRGNRPDRAPRAARVRDGEPSRSTSSEALRGSQKTG